MSLPRRNLHRRRIVSSAHVQKRWRFSSSAGANVIFFLCRFTVLDQVPRSGEHDYNGPKVRTNLLPNHDQIELTAVWNLHNLKTKNVNKPNHPNRVTSERRARAAQPNQAVKSYCPLDGSTTV